jgi:hypothetical protein
MCALASSCGWRDARHSLHHTVTCTVTPVLYCGPRTEFLINKIYSWPRPVFAYCSFYSLDPADINISSVGASCADVGTRSQVTSEMCKTLLCAEARPKFSATNSIDTYIKTDPTRRIWISHYEYSELTVHKGNSQLYRCIIEFAITRWSVNER